MKKIAFIGAGSVHFTTSVIRDMALFPALTGSAIYLMDNNKENLERITLCINKINEEMNADFKITSTLNREEALKDADAVLCTVFNGDVDIWRHEIEIPKKYGVDINVGDTRSVSGIFRALRNIPLMLDICHDMERLCPGAFMLNYTNPMSMLCKAMQTLTKVDVTGLCHSVQITSEMLSKWVGADYSKVKYTCAGINHMAVFTQLSEDGKDLYPLLREKLEDKQFYNKEKVRNEFFKAFGYYVTESSGHFSEYTPWFRKRPDLIRKYCLPEGANWNPGEYAFSLKLRTDPHRQENLVKVFLSKPVDKKLSNEYAADIINARIGDKTPFEFNANLINNGAIENLPDDVCVEIPVIAQKNGYTKMFKGALPAQIAPMVSYTAQIENLVVDAWAKKSKQQVIQAVSYDPLCSAVLSLEEIKEMCEELFKVNKDYLGDFY